MIARQTLVGVAIGIVVGAMIAVPASRLLAPYLDGVTVHDSATCAAIVGLLVVVSLGASWVPARRAGRLDPATVLRADE